MFTEKVFPPVMSRRLHPQNIAVAERVMFEIEVTGTPDRSPFLYCPYSFIRFIIFTIVQAFLGFVISDIVVHRLFYNTFKCFVFLLCPRILQQFRVD